MTLQPVVHDVGEGVLAREIKIEGFRASGRTEDAPYTAAPYKAAAPNPSAQWPLAVLPAAHRCPWGPPVVGRWSAGLLALPSDRSWSLVLEHLGKLGCSGPRAL